MTTIFSENFESYSVVGVVPTSGTSWRQSVAGTNRWVIGAASLNGLRSAYISSTGGTTGPFVNTYTNTSSTDTRLISPPINIIGGDLYLILSFLYRCNGEPGNPSPFDYGLVEYSIDGINFVQIGLFYKGVIASTTSTLSFIFPPNQSTLYLAWRWINDASFGDTPPFIIDNITLLSISASQQQFTTIFSETFESLSLGVVPNPGTTSIWRQRTISGGATNRWIIGNSALNGTKSAYISDSSGNTYTITSSTDTRLISPLINTIGAILLLLSFKFISYGDVIGSSQYDYGLLEYSLDNSTFTTLQSYGFVLINNVTTVQFILPQACLNQPTLYISWRWINDSALGTNPPFNIDDIVLSGITITINIVDSDSLNIETDGPANIYYNIQNATTVTVTGLPSGFTSSFNKNILRISGTPTTVISSAFTITASNAIASSVTVTKTDTITSFIPTLPSGLPCITGTSILGGTLVSALTGPLTIEDGLGGTTTASISRLKRYNATNLPVYFVNNGASNQCYMSGKNLLKITNQGENEPAEINYNSKGTILQIATSVSTYTGLVYRIELNTSSSVNFVLWGTGPNGQVSIEVPNGRNESNIALGTYL